MSMINKRQLLAIALCVVMVAGAGCAGWGTDGPADQDNEPENDSPSPSTNASEDGTDTDSDSDTDGENNSSDTTDSTEEPASASASGSSTSDDADDSTSSGDTAPDDEDASSDDSTSSGSDSTPSDNGSQEPSEEPTTKPNESESEPSTPNETNESETNESTGQYDDSATGIIRVVDENGEPVEGEPVTLIPPGTVEESAYEHRTTDENGEVRIELLAGDPTDVVLFDVIVRDTTQHLGIMSDKHSGVQEVVFEVDNSESSTGEENESNETNESETNESGSASPYTYSYTVEVVDENGDPLVGEEVQIGTPGEAKESYVTDEDGQVSDSFMNSAEGDVVEQEVLIRGEAHYIHVERGEQTERIVVEADDGGAPANESANETAYAAA